jgi:hypothetical protein
MLTNNRGQLTHLPKIIGPSISTKIISHTPGRLRLRVGRCDRQSEKMLRIARTLETQPKINQVQINVPQGSICINHDGIEDVLAILQDIGLMIAELGDGSTEAAVGISSAVVDLNQRVSSATNGAVDLRFLFPLGLSMLAVRQLMVKGWELEVIPWYVLAWYAFDSFMKLNRMSAKG